MYLMGNYPMKKLVILLCLLAVSGCAASGRKKVEHISKNEFSGFEEAVLNLADQVKNKGWKKLKIATGKITFENSNISSKFSAFVSSKLSLAISASAVFEEISRKDINQILSEQKLALSGVVDFSQVVQPGMIKGIDALLLGNYWEFDKNVRIDLYLVSVETAEKLGFVSLNIKKSALPKNLELKPSNYDTCLSAIELWDEIKSNADFKINVWAEKEVYNEGDEIKIYFKSSKNCYLRLYHTDVEGNVQLLFPNFYVKSAEILANKVYTIPDENMNFSFKAVKPFGAEIITAVASLKPFPDSPAGAGAGFTEKDVFVSLGMATRDNIAEIINKDISALPSGQFAVDMCIFTTVK